MVQGLTLMTEQDFIIATLLLVGVGIVIITKLDGIAHALNIIAGLN